VSDQSTSNITTLLEKSRQGDADAENQLFHAVFPRLRRIADALLGQERNKRLWQPTALVNEAYPRIVVKRPEPWANRWQLLGNARGAMRQVLIDKAREDNAAKRGGGIAPVPLTDHDPGVLADSETRVAFKDALEEIWSENPKRARMFIQRAIIGLTPAEIAEKYDLDVSNVSRHLQKACDVVRKHMEGLNRRR
jgi:RNA polymerase sigma factor (TIGR02999 family)